ncbi:MAG: hypothetical protein ABJA78_00495 [Ferruginibacter sp.]
MLDIILLIFFTRNIGTLAIKKGLKPGIWKMYTIIFWFVSEIAGVLIGLVTFPDSGFIGPAILGIGLAVLSYFVIKSNLDKKPDAIDDDIINRIGVDDLRP